MIKGIDNLLEDKNQPGLPELRNLISELLDGPDMYGELINVQKLLRSRVYRLRFAINGDMRNLVVKRFSPDRAHLEQTVIQKWLPKMGFKGNAPKLLGVAAERKGKCTWHAYEDLGESTLNKFSDDTNKIRLAVNLIADIHTNFAESPLLGECRSYGGDLGAYFFRSNINDAVRSLKNMVIPDDRYLDSRENLRESLLRRLKIILEEEKDRTQLIYDFGGSETLLHGDLWTTNIFVLPYSDEFRARLIDWDHAGVGPISYDISTFLLRFPSTEREWILDYYQERVSHSKIQLPPKQVLNRLFDTAEYSRLANTVIWLANATSESNPGWAFDDLSEVDQWFESVEPVIPFG